MGSLSLFAPSLPLPEFTANLAGILKYAQNPINL